MSVAIFFMGTPVFRGWALAQFWCTAPPEYPSADRTVCRMKMLVRQLGTSRNYSLWSTSTARRADFQRLQRYVPCLRGESHDLRELCRRIALYVVIGARHDPVPVGSGLVLQERLPDVVCDAQRRHVVVNAPHQGSAHTALGQRVEPAGFVFGPLVEVPDGVGKNAHAPRCGRSLRVLGFRGCRVFGGA